MKATFTQFEHSTLGFPKVKLKFCLDDDNGFFGAYVTVHDLITADWNWTSTNFAHKTSPEFIRRELEVFDKWVRDKYSENAAVQG
jgi:hypothetical protein